MGWTARVLTIAATVAVASSPARADDTGWPDDATVARVRRRTHVYAEPGIRQIGVLAGEAKVNVARAVVAAGACRMWVELVPRGWVCGSDIAPTHDPADARTDAAPLVEYAGIARGTMIYADVASIEDGAPTRSVHGHTNVVLRGQYVTVYGKLYVRTDQGWIARRDMMTYTPSEHTGVAIAAGAPLDVGWAVPRFRAKVVVRDAPSPRARIVRELASRERTTVYEQRDGFTRVGDDEWIVDGDVRRATLAARPDGVAVNERWLDIDLDQQVLVAYEGDAPVFATVVSTGLASATPTGVYRIQGKDVRTRMTNPAIVPDESGWNVADVPFAMRFRKNFALHGAYWHDGFGRPRSQGCVNLSPKDARWLFDFVTPEAPPGWLSVDGEGTPVRIRNARDPEPKWRDFEGKLTASR
jgi:hypothetical protein